MRLRAPVGAHAALHRRVDLLHARTADAGGAKVLSFGKARARLFSEKQNKVTFQDVAGVEEARRNYARSSSSSRTRPVPETRRQESPGRAPRGPSGTIAKTLLAKAIAGEANVPFFSISGSPVVREGLHYRVPVDLLVLRGVEAVGPCPCLSRAKRRAVRLSASGAGSRSTRP